MTSITAPPITVATLKSGPAPSAAVQGLIARHPHLKKRFHGQGRWGGAPSNPSPDEYDVQVAEMLVRKGITDPHELATALWHRPNTNAQTNGRQYVLDTVNAALAIFQAGSVTQLDFTVDRVRIYNADEPIYEFVVEGVVFWVKHDELMKPSKFAKRLTAAIKRISETMPTDRDKPHQWARVVNAWLESADQVELGDAANARALLHAAIDRVLVGLPSGTEAKHLEQGRALRDDAAGVMFVKQQAVLLGLKSQLVPQHGPGDVALFLNDLGSYEMHDVDASGTQVRCWRLQLARVGWSGTFAVATCATPQPSTTVAPPGLPATLGAHQAGASNRHKSGRAKGAA